MTGDRFVVQEHTTPEGVHWDLMIEQDGSLMTFRMPCGPGEVGVHPLPVTHIFDHPLRFLTYEGPVQKGTGRVRIADRGKYRLVGLTDGRFEAEFHGSVLQGVFCLTRREHAIWELTRGGPTE
jgi:bifunctional non-homologous end joining protein LigD